MLTRPIELIRTRVWRMGDDKDKNIFKHLNERPSKGCLDEKETSEENTIRMGESRKNGLYGKTVGILGRSY